mgnify:CR=1 FL=1
MAAGARSIAKPDAAERLADLVEQVSLLHGGQPVKWLGDGVMFYFGEPRLGVRSALEMVVFSHLRLSPPDDVGNRNRLMPVNAMSRTKNGARPM